jgi:hypothetical protein
MRKTRRLLDQISANTKDQFYSDAASILSQMNAFIINHENETFPKDAALIQGMYTAINASLNKLSWTSGVLWDKLFKDEKIAELYDRFIALSKEIEIPTGEQLEKLENLLEKTLFLAPKVYYLITETGKHIYKVKGLSHKVELNYKDFESLLYKQSFLEKIQTKWRKNLSEGNTSPKGILK